MAVRTGGPLRNKNFLIYSLGNTISWVGTWAQRIGVGWLSWDLTHQTAWVGAISLAQLLPLIAFGPLFGTLLDRHDHRRYALAVNAALTLLAVALYVLTAIHEMRIRLLCVMAVLLGIANSAYQAVRLAMINDVVTPAHLSAAIAINSVLFNVTRAVGPALAGVIIARYGIAAAFAFNAVSFVGILAALLVVHVRPLVARHAPQGLLAESREGIRYVFGHQGLRQLMLLSAITSILGRGVFELLPAFADSVFGRGSVGLAHLTTALGIGAIAGALLLSRSQGGARLPAITRYATLLLGGVVCGFGLCSSFRAGLALAGLSGFTIVLSSVGLQVLLQGQVRDNFRGRVLGLWSAFNVAGPGLGGALAGSLAQLAGLKLVTVVSGLTCVVLVAWAMPPSRRLLVETAGKDRGRGEGGET